MQQQNHMSNKYKLHLYLNYILTFICYLSKGIIYGLFICIFLILCFHKYEISREYWYETTLFDNNEYINSNKYIYSTNIVATNITHLSWWINDTSTCNVSLKCLYSQNHRFLHGHGGHSGHHSSHAVTTHSNSVGHNSHISSNILSRQSHIAYFYILANNHAKNNNYIIKKEINKIPIDLNNSCNEATVFLSCNDNNIIAFIGSTLIEPADTFITTINKIYKILIISLIISAVFFIIKFFFSICDNKNKYYHLSLL